MNSLFEPTQAVHVVIAPPQFSVKMKECYESFLIHQLNLSELVSMAIFIEWFTIEEDRSMIRSGYLTSIIHRCRRVDNVCFKSDEEFLHYYVSLGGQAPFNLDLYFRGYQPPNDVAWVSRMRIKYQREFLYISENIDKLYQEIVEFYRTHPRTGHLLKTAAEQYVGYMPYVRFGQLNGVEFSLSNNPII